jgi:hypothetical protein
MDRCGKLWILWGPEFAQTDHGCNPGDLLINPGAHPADETLASLGGSVERGIDEVADDSDVLR